MRILVLAAILPLLLPSGFCLCKFGIEHPPGTETHHHGDSHMPGCPGSDGADQLKRAETVPLIAIDLPLTDSIEIESQFTSSIVPRQRDHEGPWPSAPPPYLSQCTFVC